MNIHKLIVDAYGEHPVDNTFILIMALSFMFVGVIFLLVFFVVKASYGNKLRNCTCEVIGQLIESVRRNDIGTRDFHRDFCYYPVVEYIINGTTYKTMWNYGRTKKLLPGPVNIKYNPNKPEQFYIVGFKAPVVLYNSMLAAAISCFGVGITVLCILCI